MTDRTGDVVSDPVNRLNWNRPTSQCYQRSRHEPTARISTATVHASTH